MATGGIGGNGFVSFQMTMEWHVHTGRRAPSEALSVRCQVLRRTRRSGCHSGRGGVGSGGWGTGWFHRRWSSQRV